MNQLSGLILIDKPSGPTSSQVTQWVGQILGTKAGHCGTLDPEVTGVLPVLVGKALKLQEYLQEHDKEYVAIIGLEKELSPKALAEALAEFIGKVYQRPPEMAAVAKHLRVRHIYSIEVTEQEGLLALIKVECQHGTYVRKLVVDLGLLLGQKTTLIALRRTRINGFTEKECITLTKLKDLAEQGHAGVLLSLETAVKSLPRVFIKENAVTTVAKGAPLNAPGVARIDGSFAKGAAVAMLNQEEKLIGVGKALASSIDMKDKKRGQFLKTEKIVIG